MSSLPLQIGSSHGGRDFLLAKPVMPAAGFLGYGRGYPGILDPQVMGALVTRTTTLNPRTNVAPMVRTRGGFILPLPPANPGIAAVLRQHAPGWAHSASPVVLSTYVEEPGEMAAIGRRLEGETVVAGVELAVPYRADRQWLTDVMIAFAGECDLPLLIRLPLGLSLDLVNVAVEQEAAALVMATPHIGRVDPAGCAGPVYGPGVLPYTIDAVARTAEVAEGIPIIALGGIYCQEDAAACALAGAAAVQLDGLLLLDPAGAGRLAAEPVNGLGGVSASG